MRTPVLIVVVVVVVVVFGNDTFTQKRSTKQKRTDPNRIESETAKIAAAGSSRRLS